MPKVTPEQEIFIIQRVIATLKKSSAVTLSGQGGAYEILRRCINNLQGEQDLNE
jgi:hypothetical protein